MPKVPLFSPTTGKSTLSSFIHTTAGNFVDNAGRTLLLRGVNLSGSCKTPLGQQSQVIENIWESAEAGGKSFVGQPLNLDDGSADVHLTRLRGWGFNMLRFQVTWEALEHSGPGIYDYEFIDYTIQVLKKCREYGFRVFIDPHQDVWSRFSGGSGAPFWTFAACGINPRNLTATQAAIVHCEYPLERAANPAGLPAMIWSTNYGRLLSQTMYTLFFAGRDFAPNCIIDGKNIQDYLQEHYIEAFGKFADRIRAFDDGSLLDECVIGWDSLNEPFEGLCGWEDLSANPIAHGATLKKGTCPTPAQSLRLGMGKPQTVNNYKFGVFGPCRDGTVTIDPKGITIWASAHTETPDGINLRWGWTRDTSRWPLGTCLWALQGVWDVETGIVLRPDYFRCSPVTGKPVKFIDDYFKPHLVSWSQRIRASHSEAILFVQPPVFAEPPDLGEEVLQGRCAYSAHYYDGLTLITRHWNWFNADALGLLRGRYKNKMQAVKIGECAIRQSLQKQLGMLKADAGILNTRNGNDYPVMISEIGTPFDMDGKRSYGWTNRGKHKGDYRRQERALDASLNAADGPNSLNWTVWTYCTEHSHEWGDGWNMEDLSLWSLDDMCEKRSERQRADDEQIYGGIIPSVMDGSCEEGIVDTDQPTVIYNPDVGGSRVKLSESTTALDERQDSAAASSVTLGCEIRPTDEMTIKSRNDFSSSMLRDWFEDPYFFLQDGARAVRAFCRPWPHKIVGVPVDMKFDIGKSYFRLVVSVSSEDSPNLKQLKFDSGKEGEQLVPATEIYVPLVHYATETLMKNSRVNHGAPKMVKNPKLMQNPKDIFSLEFDVGRESRKSSHSSSRMGSTAILSTENHLLAMALVELDVKVTAGKWEVDGQMLKWWYDIPLDGEKGREYTIEIRRRSRVIKGSEGKCWWRRCWERLFRCCLST